jgi:hypothetical protein
VGRPYRPRVRPCRGLTGLLFGDPPNGEFDTALAWDSVSQLVGAIAIGVWLWVLPWTAIYFEQVNTRHRSQVSNRSDGKKPGFAIAITALVLGLFFTGPVALAVDFFAWRRISRDEDSLCPRRGYSCHRWVRRCCRADCVARERTLAFPGL